MESSQSEPNLNDPEELYRHEERLGLMCPDGVISEAARVEAGRDVEEFRKVNKEENEI